MRTYSTVSVKREVWIWWSKPWHPLENSVSRSKIFHRVYWHSLYWASRGRRGSKSTQNFVDMEAGTNLDVACKKIFGNSRSKFLLLGAVFYTITVYKCFYFDSLNAEHPKYYLLTLLVLELSMKPHSN